MNDWVRQTTIKGPANVLTVGEVQTLPDTAQAWVTITGESPAQIINFGIPEGEIGPANTLTVGTVETLLPTEPAEVTITGTSPNQTINFGIPQGVPGPGAAGVNQGTGAEVFAGADVGTGTMQFWRVRGTGLTTTSVDANGVIVNTLVSWTDVSGKPATFPPTLPIGMADVTGLNASQAAQDTTIGTKLNSSAYTAADVLSKLVTVDGAGSGLDADKLDGQEGSYYLAWANFTGKPSTFPPTLPIAQSDVTNLVSDLALKAPLASPALTGSPTAPTATAGTATTQIATTAFVAASFAPLASPALTGNPTAPTPATADDDISIATTAFVKAAITATPAPPALATVSASAPGSPQTGAIWWNSTTKTLSIWSGTAWEAVLGTWA